MVTTFAVQEKMVPLAHTDTMRAAVFHGVNDIRLEEVPRPHAGPGEAVDIIAICGPKRNRVVAAALKKAPSFRYRLDVGTDGNSFLVDQELDTTIRGSINVNSAGEIVGASGTDFGLILSMPNPFNHLRRITILAGLRGSGTAGAAAVLANPAELAAICKRRRGAITEELVKTVWNERPEQLSKVSIVR